MYYYDTNTSASFGQTAWITSYDGEGNMTDLTTVLSSGSTGYGYRISEYIGHIVDNSLQSYVLNWRPYFFGSDMRLCGMRVAYRLPLGGGTWSEFYYKFVTGSTFTPRNSSTEWAYTSGGCIYARDWADYLPVILK